MHNVITQLVDPDDDFLTSQSIVTTFFDGSAETEATAVIINDAIPEGNETFTLRISDISSGAIGALNTMQLIIRANDQPYGVFQYHMVGTQHSLRTMKFQYHCLQLGFAVIRSARTSKCW